MSDASSEDFECTMCDHAYKSARGLRKHMAYKHVGSPQKRARPTADDDSDDSPPAKRMVLDASPFGELSTKMDALQEALDYYAKYMAIERRRVIVDEKMTATSTRINELRHSIEEARKDVDEMDMEMDGLARALRGAITGTTNARANWDAAEASYKALSAKATKISGMRASMQQALAAATASIEGFDEFSGRIDVSFNLTLSDAQGQPIDDTAVARETLLDALAPGLCQAIDAALRAVANAKAVYMGERDNRDHLETAIEMVELEIAVKRVDIKENTEAEEELKEAHTGIETLLGSLTQTLQLDFIDAEANESGAFAALSADARALVREMRSSPATVATFGRLAERVVARVPNVLVAASPLVLNDEVLNRDRGCSIDVPEHECCAICREDLDKATMADPLVCTDCDHFFHASCMNSLFIGDDTNYDRVVAAAEEEGVEVVPISAPCPVCRHTVQHTDLCIVDASRYFF